MRGPATTRGQLNLAQAVVALALALSTNVLTWWGTSTWKRAEIAEDHRRAMEANAADIRDIKRWQAETDRAIATWSYKAERTQAAVEAQGEAQAIFFREIRDLLRPRQGVRPASK